MNLNLSPAEVGAIVYGLENTYTMQSDEYQLAQDLIQAVYEHFEEMSPHNADEMHDNWLMEFGI